MGYVIYVQSYDGRCGYLANYEGDIANGKGITATRDRGVTFLSIAEANAKIASLGWAHDTMFPRGPGVTAYAREANR
jgi:hypothetical protein